MRSCTIVTARVRLLPKRYINDPTNREMINPAIKNVSEYVSVNIPGPSHRSRDLEVPTFVQVERRRLCANRNCGRP